MGKIKKVAGTDEPIVRVEVVAKPIVVQNPALAIPVEVKHVTVTIRILPDKICKASSIPLPLEYSRDCI